MKHVSGCLRFHRAHRYSIFHWRNLFIPPSSLRTVRRAMSSEAVCAIDRTTSTPYNEKPWPHPPFGQPLASSTVYCPKGSERRDSTTTIEDENLDTLTADGSTGFEIHELDDCQATFAMQDPLMPKEHLHSQILREAAEDTPDTSHQGFDRPSTRVPEEFCNHAAQAIGIGIADPYLRRIDALTQLCVFRDHILRLLPAQLLGRSNSVVFEKIVMDCLYYGQTRIDLPWAHNAFLDHLHASLCEKLQYWKTEFLSSFPEQERENLERQFNMDVFGIFAVVRTTHDDTRLPRSDDQFSSDSGINAFCRLNTIRVPPEVPLPNLAEFGLVRFHSTPVIHSTAVMQQMIDNVVGSLLCVLSIVELLDGSWEIVVHKSYRGELAKRLHTQFPGSKVDFDYDPLQWLFNNSKSQFGQTEWEMSRYLFGKRAREMQIAWPLAARFYASLAEMLIPGWSFEFA
nr:hypothetical protein CFP56_56558 [Quercus suber]